jgi:hypothetical protein
MTNSPVGATPSLPATPVPPDTRQTDLVAGFERACLASAHQPHQTTSSPLGARCGLLKRVLLPSPVIAVRVDRVDPDSV